ncbi:hypothetical protein [Plasmodium yoelii yoelii]|uniref:Uncharacterized protein n=1 Tax=Plasmodium yoelii yoelii TaxID=73239 RepID=Q7RGJ3_PLAYO|nr:hypothetical protein [Plasmodium yoelii yoelii]
MSINPEYITPFFFSEFNLNESIIMREKAHTNVINFYCVFKVSCLISISKHQIMIDLKHFEIQDKFLINLLLVCVDESPFMRPSFSDIFRLLFDEIVRNELEEYYRERALHDF